MNLAIIFNQMYVTVNISRSSGLLICPLDLKTISWGLLGPGQLEWLMFLFLRLSRTEIYFFSPFLFSGTLTMNIERIVLIFSWHSEIL